MFDTQERAIAVGECIQFTTPWKEKGVASRDTAVVEQLEANGNIAVRLENGRRVAWNLRDYDHIDHAYAMTATRAAQLRQALSRDNVKDTSLSNQQIENHAGQYTLA